MARCIALFLTFLSFYSVAAPKSEHWPFWDQSVATNEAAISHEAWQSFLDNFLVQQGEYTLVKYREVPDSEKTKLKNYIASLANLDPRQYSKPEQYAYWVNLYNAITVDLILDAYPIKSITKLGGLFSFGPWEDDVVKVQGKELTLNDIEHRILRPIWNDPRTHYAVNCASLGCPNLQKQAFTAQNTEQLLEQAAHEFVNSSKGVKQRQETTQLSSIYDWFGEDFGSKAQLVEHLKTYRPDLSGLEGKLSYEYNWDLNEKK